MTRTRRIALAWILLASGISIWWGSSIGQNANGWVDFRAVYYGTRCLLQDHNPYNVSELEAVYRADGGERPTETVATLQAVVLYVNLPTTFIFTAPFAMLPWGPAHWLWLTLADGVFVLAAFLVWDMGSSHAPGVSLFLICILLANCEMVFCTGNTAGIVIGLCVVAVWCFFRERFVWAGVLCLAISLAMKPHDVGLVWLFFLLAGTPWRKRALQTLLVTVVLGLAALLWVSHVAPGWIGDWRSNLSAISVPGGINEPGPSSLTGRSPAMVIDLQAAISIFRDDPRIYNPASYLVCGALLLAWSVRTLRLRSTWQSAWLEQNHDFHAQNDSIEGVDFLRKSTLGSRGFGYTYRGFAIALAAIAPLTMLVTYHRPWDAKLLMLTIPACAILWTEGGRTRWLSLGISTAGVVLTGDVPLAILALLANKLHRGTAGIFNQMLTVVLIRPASLILLVMSVFYLCIYLRHAPSEAGTTPEGPWGKPIALP